MCTENHKHYLSILWAIVHSHANAKHSHIHVKVKLSASSEYSIFGIAKSPAIHYGRRKGWTGIASSVQCTRVVIDMGRTTSHVANTCSLLVFFLIFLSGGTQRKKWEEEIWKKEACSKGLNTQAQRGTISLYLQIQRDSQEGINCSWMRRREKYQGGQRRDHEVAVPSISTAGLCAYLWYCTIKSNPHLVNHKLLVPFEGTESLFCYYLEWQS